MAMGCGRLVDASGVAGAPTATGDGEAGDAASVVRGLTIGEERRAVGEVRGFVSEVSAAGELFSISRARSAVRKEMG
jgi:hypothetical protein